jgi:hypothetical protein
MNKRIQCGVSAFDEVEFPTEPGTETIVLKVTNFASIIIVGFDLVSAKVGDIAVGVIHAGFLTKTAFWLKIHSDLNGRQWSILQTSKTMFFTSP